MKNTTKWNLTLVTGVIFPSPPAAGRDLITDGRGRLYGPTPTMTSIKDVAYFRCRRALV